MQYRHEYKLYLNYGDYLVLKQRLSSVLAHDVHTGPEGGYRIRSLYWDNFRDKALREKLDSISQREKFRLRTYPDDPRAPLKLEKKSKNHGLCHKQCALLSPEEATALLAGDTDWMAASGRAVAVELYSKMKSQLLRPTVIVEYLREPFVFPAGNVRVTLDRCLRSGLKSTDFFRDDLPLIAAGDAAVILEVKYDNFIPDLITDIIRLNGRRAAAFSKYAVCRMYD